MNIEILRTYDHKGTNGDMKVDGLFISHTIELPWKENKTGISCIPEGTYEVKRRFSEKYGKHLIVTNVSNRELILFHPANDAAKELRGCIAPVTTLAGIGKGILSRQAFNKLLKLANSAFDKDEKVFLTTKKQDL